MITEQRLAVIQAHRRFYQHHAEGPGCPLFARLLRLTDLVYANALPSPDNLSKAAQRIYIALEEKHLLPCDRS